MIPVEQFREVANSFTKQYDTPEKALALLVEEGIYNPDGTLTKEYA